MIGISSIRFLPRCAACGNPSHGWRVGMVAGISFEVSLCKEHSGTIDPISPSKANAVLELLKSEIEKQLYRNPTPTIEEEAAGQPKPAPEGIDGIEIIEGKLVTQ